MRQADPARRAEAPLLGGVELGGTKCICSIGSGPDDIRAQTRIPTGNDPAGTLRRIEDILEHGIALHGPIQALGVASFGPLDLAPSSPTFGWVTSTPKPGWRDTRIAPRLGQTFGVPLAFDTDVNGAALAEGRWGAARGLEDFAYITVGTGIGVGVVAGGQRVHGFGHPELGHIRVARRPGDDFEGICAFHGACVEGLASGPAITARTGLPASALAPDHPVWAAVAHDLAQLVQTIVFATAPRRVLMGGGVLEDRPELIARVRRELEHSINGYLDLAARVGDLDGYIVAPGLGAAAGPLGALALAATALGPLGATEAPAPVL